MLARLELKTPSATSPSTAREEPKPIGKDMELKLNRTLLLSIQQSQSHPDTSLRSNNYRSSRYLKQEASVEDLTILTNNNLSGG
jgi:hypothetical protein